MQLRQRFAELGAAFLIQRSEIEVFEDKEGICSGAAASKECRLPHHAGG